MITIDDITAEELVQLEIVLEYYLLHVDNNEITRSLYRRVIDRINNKGD